MRWRQVSRTLRPELKHLIQYCIDSWTEKMHLFRFRERLRHSGCRILEPVNVIAVRKVQSAERWSPRYSRGKKKRECVRLWRVAVPRWIQESCLIPKLSTPVPVPVWICFSHCILSRCFTVAVQLCQSCKSKVGANFASFPNSPSPTSHCGASKHDEKKGQVGQAWNCLTILFRVHRYEPNVPMTSTYSILFLSYVDVL